MSNNNNNNNNSNNNKKKHNKSQNQSYSSSSSVHHEPHSNTAPQIDLSQASWTLPPARQLSTSLAEANSRNHDNDNTSFSSHDNSNFSLTNDADLDLMVDVKDHIEDQHNEHVMGHSRESNSSLQSYQQSPPNSVHSVSIDRSSPSSLILHQCLFNRNLSHI